MFTDEEMIDARSRAKRDAEQGYTIWVRVLAELEEARAEIERLRREVEDEHQRWLRAEDRLREATAEIERLRNGLPNPVSTRFGVEAEPWEGNGPCMDCEGRSPHWHAPDDLWKRVMARPNVEDDYDPPGVICPVCFVIRGWKKGLFTDPMVWWTWTPIPNGFLPRGDFDWAIDERNKAQSQLAALRRKDELAQAVVEAASELATCQPDDIDPRLRYVYIQPGRDEWEAFCAVVAAYREESGRE